MAYSKRFDAALLYAHQLHRSQERKESGVPYVTHLLAVAAIVGEAGGHEDLVIAALLHDAIEDQGGKPTAVEIERRFGLRVRTIVEGCSDTDVSPKPPWRARKEAYLAGLETHDGEVLLVSLADKLHNVRSIILDHARVGSRVWERFSGKRVGTQWYYTSLAEIYGRRMADPLVQSFQGEVRRLESLKDGKECKTTQTQASVRT